jgi:hypothetical protein
MQVTFSPAYPFVTNMTATPSPVVIATKPRQFVTDSEGYMSDPVDGFDLDGKGNNRNCQIIASDDPDITPTGWKYLVTFTGPGATNFRAFRTPAPAGAVVDMAIITPQRTTSSTAPTAAEIAAANAAASAAAAQAAVASINKGQAGGVAPLDNDGDVNDAFGNKILGGGGGGGVNPSTILSKITDMSPLARQLNADTTQAAMRARIGAGTGSGTSNLVIGTTAGTAADAAALATSLAAKANTSTTVNTVSDQTIDGVKTYLDPPVIPAATADDNPVTRAQLNAAVAGTGADANLVHKTGAETVAGIKTFTDGIAVPDASLTISDINGLNAALTTAGGVQIRTWDGDSYEPSPYDTSKTTHVYKNGPNPLTIGQPFGVYDEWWKLITAAPAPANTITIGSAKKALAGTDIIRGTGQIVRYVRSVDQTVTPTGPAGIEVTVSLLTGLVTARNDRVATGSTTGTTIPVDHYVLSGEGKGTGTAGQWLLDNATIGAAVVLSQETTPPTDPDPEVPPVQPSGLHAKPIMMDHTSYTSTAPLLSSYPAPVLAEVNTIRLNYAQAATSGTGTLKYTEANGQTTAQILAAVNAHKTAGRDVFLAIGGGGGADGGITVTNDTEADQMVASIKSLASTIGINGIVFDIQSTRWTEAAIMRVASRLKTDLGTGFVIGINNKTSQWISVGVSLANNLDFMSPGLWNQVEATDSRLTALTTSTVSAMVTAGIPASKIVPVYALGSAGSNLTPTTALVDTAWTAALTANPNLRGIGFWDDIGLAARSTPYDGPLDVGPTVRGVLTGRYTSFTVTRDATTPTTELDLAWTFSGTATLTSQSLSRSGGTTGGSIINNPAAATRTYTDSGRAPNTQYTYTLTGTLSTGETITAVASQTTQAVSVPGGTGSWISGSSGPYTTNGQFGNWRNEPVELGTTWSTLGGAAQGPAAHTGLWQFDPGKEYVNWTGHCDLSVGAIWTGHSTWASAAAGGNDGLYTTMFNNLKAKWTAISRGTVYIRYAHEMNGNWYDWSVPNGQQANFIAAWRRFVNIGRSIFPAAKYTFGTNGDTSGQQYNWTSLWPGDSYVDVYATDWYSNHWIRCGQQINETLDQWGGPVGIEAHRKFALAHGVPFAMPEWGMNNGATGTTQTGQPSGDQPLYIEHMYNWYKLHSDGNTPGRAAGKIEYEALFNDVWSNHQFDLFPESGTRSPNSSLKYKTLFANT